MTGRLQNDGSRGLEAAGSEPYQTAQLAATLATCCSRRDAGALRRCPPVRPRDGACEKRWEGDVARTELKAWMRAALRAEGRALLLDARGLAGPWVIPVDGLAEVRWYSRTGALFRAVLAPPGTADRAPVCLLPLSGLPYAVLVFREPRAVPYRFGRTLWPRWTVVWEAGDSLLTADAVAAAHSSPGLRDQLAGLRPGRWGGAQGRPRSCGNRVPPLRGSRSPCLTPAFAGVPEERCHSSA